MRKIQLVVLSKEFSNFTTRLQSLKMLTGIIVQRYIRSVPLFLTGK